jgi:aspartate/methionine/tyrosine aminotransferase
MSTPPTKFTVAIRNQPKSFNDYAQVYCGRNDDVTDLGSDANELTLDILLPVFQSMPSFDLYHLGYMAAKNDWPLLDRVSALFQAKFAIPADRTRFYIVESDLAFLFERISRALCESGDVILLPNRFPRTYSNYFYLSQATLVYLDADNLPDVPPERSKVLFVSSPPDPFDCDVARLVRWALVDPSIHVFVNCSWGLLGGPHDFPTADRLHVIYALDRFLGTSGFRASLLYTADPAMLTLVKLCNGSNRNSSYTEFLYEKVMALDIVDRIVQVFNERFGKAKEIVKRLFEDVRVFEKSVFAKVDLTQFIKTVKEEERFAKELLERYRVWVVPAAVEFGEATPGFFLVNVARPAEDLQNGIAKLLQGIADLKNRE